MTDEILMTVRDNPSANRFEMDTSAGLALIDYWRHNGVVTMTHAEVPPELNGQGLGAQLAKGALEIVQSNGEKVIPVCPFILAYIKRHKEYQPLVADDTFR